MRHLYWQIYLGLVAGIVLLTILAAIVWVALPPTPSDTRLLDGVGAIIADHLPSADRPLEELETALHVLSERLPAHLSVFDAEGTQLAFTGTPLPPPRHDQVSGWAVSRGSGPTVMLRLPDGRWFAARHAQWPRHRPLGTLLVFGGLAAAIVIGAYPVVRHMTRRLERLQKRVDELGEGDLSARVHVEGNDEVGRLATSFNRAAERIERLVNAQRSVLAGASHELRTPLTRMRVAVELMQDERTELRERISKDIQELDELIGELLLASRLDSIQSINELSRNEDVDLLALAAEEAARTEAKVSGEPLRIHGEPRMLRRMIRNLLDNAKRYAGDGIVEVDVGRSAGGEIRLRVTDSGPGVPAEERERIFEPFYRPPSARTQSDSGVGLGLALVRQIAERHEGTVRCLPADGGGTCFEVLLAAPQPD